MASSYRPRNFVKRFYELKNGYYLESANLKTILNKKTNPNTKRSVTTSNNSSKSNNKKKKQKNPN